MKKYILPFLLITFGIVTPISISASSNMEISNRADFSSENLDFNGGDVIFVRVLSSSVGRLKSQLNLRDNRYNLVNTFNLEREGGYYSTALPAPYNAGYYSLEAKIESEGSNSTSVKTIKVGNVAGASVKVNVESKVAGTNSNNVSASGEQAKSGSSMDKESHDDQSSQDVLGETTADTSDKKSDNFFDSIVNFCRKVFDFAWPF